MNRRRRTYAAPSVIQRAWEREIILVIGILMISVGGLLVIGIAVIL